ncbi:GNAT family N-acetyltransferase [Kitasatospora sp. NPDC052896]|uniref:GNAT family N-acetyltransferase n=1 Tax=Kitasatospora sp. NPDC052896 TaxID=3364061 RepID=UPI0037C8911B
MTTTTTLRAEGLLLRPWRPEDATALADAARDALLRRFTSLAVADPTEARAWIDVQRHGWRTGERLAFAVFAARSDAVEGELLGQTVLKRNSEAGQGVAEVGYWTSAPARGRAVAPRALEALTRWAFASYELDRLELFHRVDNHGSCRVAEKAGYPFRQLLSARPPAFPREGHLHVRTAAAPAG